MYHCIKCNKKVIVSNSNIIRACTEDCINEPIVAEVSATMIGLGGVSN